MYTGVLEGEAEILEVKRFLFIIHIHAPMIIKTLNDELEKLLTNYTLHCLACVTALLRRSDKVVTPSLARGVQVHRWVTHGCQPQWTFPSSIANCEEPEWICSIVVAALVKYCTLQCTVSQSYFNKIILSSFYEINTLVFYYWLKSFKTKLKCLLTASGWKFDWK